MITVLMMWWYWQIQSRQIEFESKNKEMDIRQSWGLIWSKLQRAATLHRLRVQYCWRDQLVLLLVNIKVSLEAIRTQPPNTVNLSKFEGVGSTETLHRHTPRQLWPPKIYELKTHVWLDCKQWALVTNAFNKMVIALWFSWQCVDWVLLGKLSWWKVVINSLINCEYKNDHFSWTLACFHL